MNEIFDSFCFDDFKRDLLKHVPNLSLIMFTHATMFTPNIALLLFRSPTIIQTIMFVRDSGYPSSFLGCQSSSVVKNVKI